MGGIGVAAIILNWIGWSSLSLQQHVLKVSVLDIGQGDSILLQGPTGLRILVDGGPDQSVLRKLPSAIGVFAQRIDMIVETHPDKDHIAGLVDVFDKYRISYFLSPGVPGTTDTAQALDGGVASEPGIHAFLARRGMRIHLGGGAYADILYPDRDMSRQTATNDASITMRVVYGATSFMLTGDLPSKIEEHLLSLGTNELETTVLKAGHHGSKSSTGDAWLAALHPSVVAISAGKGNSYHHPNQETLDRIAHAGARIASTIEHGTLTFVSDGVSVLQSNER